MAQATEPAAVLRRASLATRLTAYAVSAALGIIVLVALGGTVLSWRAEMQRVEQTIEQIERASLPLLTAAVWDHSPRLVGQAESLLLLPHVAGLRIDSNGPPILAGRHGTEDLIQRSFPLRHQNGELVGTLAVSFDLSSVRRKAIHEALWLAAIMAIPVAAMALVGLLLFRSLVGRHLLDLAAYARGLTLAGLDRTFRFQRPQPAESDELDLLAAALSSMRANLREEIARRDQAEQHLGISEQRYREVFNATGDALFVHDATTGALLDVNHAATRLYGFSRDELLAFDGVSRLSSGVPPYDLASAQAHIAACVAHGHQLFEWRGRHASGHLFWVEVSLAKVAIGGDERVIASVRDIESRKLAEEQVRHLQRQESVGQLAGGIAHDFNNLLAGMLGAAELAQLKLEAGHPVQRHLTTIQRASERAADLTRQLLTFARRNPRNVGSVDVHTSIAAVCSLLERSLPSSIRVETRLLESRPAVLADATELENAILNLCVNARDAMPDGGILTITTTLRQLSAADCANQQGFRLDPGPHVVIDVRDTGTGIAPEILSRIFEPFFTTKDVGRGTGLGLAAVYGAVSAMHGAITVCTELGRGTAFSLLLPVCASVVSTTASEAAPQTRMHRVILVVDDDAVPRQFAIDALGEIGCTALHADCCANAVELLRSAITPPSAVILDYSMPGLSGALCLQALRQIRPDLPVVVCSGHARDEAVERMLALGRAVFLAKPYRIAALRQALSTLLDQA
jgi:PAS domain S-box-containing protein